MRPLHRALAATGAVAVCAATAMAASAADVAHVAVRQDRAGAAGRPVTTVLGQGAHRLVLRISQDAYQGDARYTVTVDGRQLGGEITASAAHGTARSDRVLLRGDWSGVHQVAVRFVNDAYAGSADKDRNLYLESAGYDGHAITGVARELYGDGDEASFSFGQGDAPAPTTPAPSPTTSNPSPTTSDPSPTGPVPSPSTSEPTPTSTDPAPTGTSSTRLDDLGVNLASGGFGDNVPGTYGTDYLYPSHDDIDYFASKGMDVVRLGLRWQRLQHTQGGPLDPTDLAKVDDLVAYAATKSVKVLLDPHNFGVAFGHDIGSAETPTSSFVDFWAKLAGHYAGTSNVLFGLMNEPHNQSAEQWEPVAQAAVDAIRGAGATSQEILVGGTYWDNAKDWTHNDNATVMAKVHDPANSMAFEVHVYFDPGSGGTSPEAVSPTIGVERISEVTDWARKAGVRLFLGEFGASSDATNLAALDNTLSYMEQNRDVWQGGTYWAGGPGWGDYFSSIEPDGGADKPQMPVLVKHTRP